MGYGRTLQPQRPPTGMKLLLHKICSPYPRVLASEFNFSPDDITETRHSLDDWTSYDSRSMVELDAPSLNAFFFYLRLYSLPYTLSFLWRLTGLRTLTTKNFTLNSLSYYNINQLLVYFYSTSMSPLRYILHITSTFRNAPRASSNILLSFRLFL